MVQGLPPCLQLDKISIISIYSDKVTVRYVYRAVLVSHVAAVSRDRSGRPEVVPTDGPLAPVGRAAQLSRARLPATEQRQAILGLGNTPMRYVSYVE